MGQDCTYYQRFKKKKKLCTQTAKEWLDQNHKKYEFEKNMPVHAFELDYDESNMDILDSLCEIGYGYSHENGKLSDSVQVRLKKQLDIELKYRLKFLIKKEPEGKCHHYMFELYQGFQWHVLEFFFDVTTLQLNWVEFIDEDDCKRKIIKITAHNKG